MSVEMRIKVCVSQTEIYQIIKLEINQLLSSISISKMKIECVNVLYNISSKTYTQVRI